MDDTSIICEEYMDLNKISNLFNCSIHYGMITRDCDQSIFSRCQLLH